MQTKCENPPDHSGAGKATVYFDGGCPLCTLEIEHYASQPGSEQLDFVDVSDQEVELAPDLSLLAARKRFHVRLADGTLVSGARAFVAIWNVLPGWYWAARMARIPGGKSILEGAYRLFLPVRPMLSKLAGKLGAKAANPCSDHKTTWQ